ACSELRRTLRWPPAIPEMLGAIREQELRWQYRLRCAFALPHDYAEALSKLLERRASLARPPAEKKAEREDRLARLENLKRQNAFGREQVEEPKIADPLPKTAIG